MKNLSKGIMATSVVFGAISTTFAASSVVGKKPNIIVIYVDDLGYGDLQCYGSKANSTPNLNRMAKEGMRFTDFYSACAVCSPSRAALLTGCYPKRIDMSQGDYHSETVLFPVAFKGLNPDEDTIADVLKRAGYKTGCFGKWHVGDQKPFLPNQQGFDYYFGVPYSNDMVFKGDKPYRPVMPLMRNNEVIEAMTDQTLLTKRLTEEAVSFIKQNHSEPFFVYFPHTMVHVPVVASKPFRKITQNSMYGDSLAEVDWSVGQVLKTLKELNIADNTLVIFSSDNGGSRHHSNKIPGTNDYRASNKPLKGWKCQPYEGGFRVPGIAWWPKHIKANSVNDQIASTMDLLPTFAELAETRLPQRKIDGKSIINLLTDKDNSAKSPTNTMFYYNVNQLQAVRHGDWKLYLPLKERYIRFVGKHKNTVVELYNLRKDIAESKNVAAENPEIVTQLMKLADDMINDIGSGVGKNSRQGKNVRSAGYVKYPQPLLKLNNPQKWFTK
ncbi:sulfatase [Lentisphaerota bacterium WC36G]|nr:sulfatase [Lentisphaerae bacterium WC36]